MKYRKLIANYFDQKSNNNAQIALALVAGLAAGAVISVLFAKNSGEETRGKISNKAKDLKFNFQDKYNALREKVFGVEALEEEIVAEEAPYIKHPVAKKPKSDLKSILEDAHQNGQVQEGKA